MQTAFRLKPSSMPRWLQYLLMVVAGIGSFYVSLQMNLSQAPDDSAVELSKKSVNVVSVSEKEVNTATLAAPIPAVSSSISRSTLGQPTRLAAGLLQNPFGPLNISVTVESLSMLAPTPVLEVKPSRNPKISVKAAVPAPPLVQGLPPTVVVPTAPPLPFRVLGSIQGDRIAGGVPVAFLADRNGTLVVRAGDQIENIYQVDRITAEKIDFTYLPLKTVQSLSISH